MNITYNKQINSIEIDDGIRIQNFVIIASMSIAILNAIINLFYSNNKEIDLISYIWIVLGVVSLILMMYLLLKKSSLNSIPLENINGLREKMFLGKKSFVLELTNGKSRDLAEFKNPNDISELKNLLEEIGVRVL